MLVLRPLWIVMVVSPNRAPRAEIAKTSMAGTEAGEMPKPFLDGL